MRIAFVSDAVYPYNKGGKEKRLYELSVRLSKMGHDVHIYTMRWWDGPEKVRKEHGVTLHAMCKYYPMYKANSDRRDIKEAIMFSLSCFKLLRAKFDVLDVDHMPYFPIYVTWIVCKLKRRRLNGTWHEALKRSEWIDYMGWKGNIAALIERVSIRLPDTITVSSAHTMELIQTELKRTKGLRLVPPGIDLSNIKKVDPIKINFDILFVGRLVKDKNAALLVRAMQLLKTQNPSIECLIIGEGPEKKNLRRLIKKLDLESNVHLLGGLVEDDDIYAHMKAAKVLAFPSKREGFGIVALEALACGTPVVTLDVPNNASRSLIENGMSGSLVSPKAHTLAAALEEWMEKSPLQHTITRHTIEYDWKKLATKQIGIYAA